ncbi:MAG: RagB/SusD family nutrient uptake outer membrane protein [Prevotella histicola]|jgi:susD family protein|uniref:RagB/SusD family nutrient uptake outer membrane protein n=1 Tax=Prevotella histicola TaxID=470565 RepID=UPI001CB1E2AC|nr:RagB/SusD family nutrient uptake outer membrane protein [Prevotella histicola]MBF1392195.1 RagB/SusD family nutrient uptake outer membrane protein [Prevotella histicola]MBF1416504.1 RagB/SusD family nutrient uptake outer membrane protein [Prevotella histicola]
MNKLYKYAALLAVPAALMTASSCTDLSETLYDQVASNNYYNTKNDVIRAVLRPFEHGFWSIQNRHVLNEESADQLITPTRGDWWDDGGRWARLHRHKWLVTNGEAQSEFNGCYQGIGQANKVIEDLDKLSASKFGFSEDEFKNLRAQNHVLRAWFYIRLLDAFRNIYLSQSFYDQSKNSKEQVPPKEIFDFIEKDLKEALPELAKKTSLGGNGKLEGQWTQAGAAALLVRLYMNAKVYIGEDHFADAEQYAQDIVDGKYGTYAVADRWDAAFDWDNENCDEVIFAFPSSGETHWHYKGDMYWWSVPSKANDWLHDTKSREGSHNIKYSASPSYNPKGEKYNYELGMPIAQFKKYPSDVRLKMYKNLSNGRREGMFIFGKIQYTDDNGNTQYLKDHHDQYTLDLRDAVGKFGGTDGSKWLDKAASRLEDGDDNSGWMFAKYPLYSDNEEDQQFEADYCEVRLPEIIYSLAECKLRKGDTSGAAKLLNSVRKRNYPSSDWSTVLYAPEGAATLDMKEMLAEWGREFFAEGRRRIDLIRFGKFGNAWWDKEADADNHTEIFPFHTETLNTHTGMKQNPGYN